MAEAEGATYVRGQLVDRLAPGGILRRIVPEQSLWDQFPVACHVAEGIAGPHDRVFAFRVRSPAAGTPGTAAALLNCARGPAQHVSSLHDCVLPPVAWSHSCEDQLQTGGKGWASQLFYLQLLIVHVPTQVHSDLRQFAARSMKSDASTWGLSSVSCWFSEQAFLRVEDEGHKVVPPEHAAQYWAPCKEEPAMAAEAGIYKDCFGANGVEPVKLSGYFHLTPYAKWSSRCGHGLYIHSVVMLLCKRSS